MSLFDLGICRTIILFHNYNMKPPSIPKILIILIAIGLSILWVLDMVTDTLEEILGIDTTS